MNDISKKIEDLELKFGHQFPNWYKNFLLNSWGCGEILEVTRDTSFLAESNQEMSQDNAWGFKWEKNSGS